MARPGARAERTAEGTELDPGERGRDLLDVVLVVVEVNGEAQVAVAGGGDDAALLQLGEQPRRIPIAKRHRDDGAAVGLREVDGRPADVCERAPERARQLPVPAEDRVGAELGER